MEGEKVDFRLEDLVVLQYASNNCYVQVLDFIEGSRDALVRGPININLRRGMWSYREWQDKKIGETRISGGGYERKRFGVIGVYDRTDITHLSSMVRDAIEAVKEMPSPLDD